MLLVLLLGTAKITADRQSITVVEEVLLTVVAPVQGVFQRLTRSVESTLATVQNYQLMLEENERLHDQLAATAAMEVRLIELQQENNRLRAMLDFAERSDYELIPAAVVARDPSNWFYTITINRGRNHGVRDGMAVMTSEGLIGNVYSAQEFSSQVLLLTDGRRAVSSLVQRSREPGEVEVGVVENDPDRPGYLRMINLPREANIQPGDTIISSGLGEMFPKGLLIGHVLETMEDELGITQYAFLKPAANFNRLEEVFVVDSQGDSDGEES
ncbi:rod shape-determining protein MreC [Dethiobacter alkaliphilus]|uniref:rod shape-determining protein MreC n=1 Tax=Dethiobacter alkaliphilus TaxID=427926 RepID=UPI002227FC60|nr:rod shape-determining protein MreC [Dethiobacter alkaliphilus]MCW3491352.1 rod shape-determining protein MreC [Dethiobacter alkaliphilus]